MTEDLITDQLALETDGLMPPFYAVIWRYHVERRDDDNDLRDLLSGCYYGEEAGEHHVTEIGDANGWLWKRPEGLARDFKPADRAPWPHPYSKIERDY
jgi:hypothetical protein